MTLTTLFLALSALTATLAQAGFYIAAVALGCAVAGGALFLALWKLSEEEE